MLYLLKYLICKFKKFQTYIFNIVCKYSQVSYHNQTITAIEVQGSPSVEDISYLSIVYFAG